MKKTTIFLSVLCVAAFAAFGWQTARAGRMEQAVDGMREQAFFSLMDGLQDVELNLSKLMISATPRQGAQLLSKVSMQAGEAQENLSQLPLEGQTIQASAKFVNQLADYARFLTMEIADGRMLTDTDIQQLGALLDHCIGLNNRLREMRATQTGLWWEVPDEGTVAPLELAMGTENEAEYPTLIYDGPFSDGKHEGLAKGLENRPVSAEEALEQAIAFVGRERVTATARSSDTLGPVASFGYVLDTTDGRLTVHVTQRGGQILWIMPETAHVTAALSLEDCVTRARDFLVSRGFGDMEASYYQEYEGLAVINFAATQGEVLLYPDLIKLQVRMDTGAVVGLEANNYWMNHAPRELAVPGLSLAEAREMVSERLEVKTSRLCVIPQEKGERLCYEFVGSWSGSEFIVYIDSLTGREIEILKIIDAENGRLTA